MEIAGEAERRRTPVSDISCPEPAVEVLVVEEEQRAVETKESERHAKKKEIARICDNCGEDQDEVDDYCCKAGMM